MLSFMDNISQMIAISTELFLLDIADKTDRCSRYHSTFPVTTWNVAVQYTYAEGYWFLTGVSLWIQIWPLWMFKLLSLKSAHDLRNPPLHISHKLTIIQTKFSGYVSYQNSTGILKSLLDTQSISVIFSICANGRTVISNSCWKGATFTLPASY